jgi:hypothetical protein
MFRRLLQAIGLISVILFCVNAAAGISDTNAADNKSLSEPINMLLVGMGLIGLASFLKIRLIR